MSGRQSYHQHPNEHPDFLATRQVGGRSHQPSAYEQTAAYLTSPHGPGRRSTNTARGVSYFSMMQPPDRETRRQHPQTPRSMPGLPSQSMEQRITNGYASQFNGLDPSTAALCPTQTRGNGFYGAGLSAVTGQPSFPPINMHSLAGGFPSTAEHLMNGFAPANPSAGSNMLHPMKQEIQRTAQPPYMLHSNQPQRTPQAHGNPNNMIHSHLCGMNDPTMRHPAVPRNSTSHGAGSLGSLRSDLMINPPQHFEDMFIGRKENASQIRKAFQQQNAKAAYPQNRPRRQPTGLTPQQHHHHQQQSHLQYSQNFHEKKLQNMEQGQLHPVDSLTKTRQKQAQANFHQPEGPRSHLRRLPAGMPTSGDPRHLSMVQMPRLPDTRNHLNPNPSQYFNVDHRSHHFHVNNGIGGGRAMAGLESRPVVEPINRWMSSLEKAHVICKEASKAQIDAGTNKCLHDTIACHQKCAALLRGEHCGVPIETLKQDIERVCEEAARIKSRMESPMSNTSTINAPLIDGEEYPDQCQTLGGEHRGRPGLHEDNRFEMKALERPEMANGVEDIGPAESSNRHLNQNKEKNGDEVIVLDNADETEGSKRRQPQKLPVNEASLMNFRNQKDHHLRQQQQQQQVYNSPPEKYSQNKRAHEEVFSKESRRKREIGRESPVPSHRGPRRKVEEDYFTSPLPGFDWEKQQQQPQNTERDAFEQTKTPQDQHIEEDRGSNAETKVMKNCVKVEMELLDTNEMEELVDEIEDWKGEVPWFYSELQLESEDYEHDWKFERTILEKLSCSLVIPTQDDACSCKKVFRTKTLENTSLTVQDLQEGDHDEILVEELSGETQQDQIVKLMETIKGECEQLKAELNLTGDFTYHTTCLDYSDNHTISDLEDFSTDDGILLQYKDFSKELCDITFRIDGSYPNSVPTVLFSSSVSGDNDPGDSSHALRNVFLSRLIDLEICSISKSIQLWIELTAGSSLS